MSSENNQALSVMFVHACVFSWALFPHHNGTTIDQANLHNGGSSCCILPLPDFFCASGLIVTAGSCGAMCALSKMQPAVQQPRLRRTMILADNAKTTLTS